MRLANMTIRIDIPDDTKEEQQDLKLDALDNMKLRDRITQYLKSNPELKDIKVALEN